MKKNGLTLIESMLSITLITIMILGTFLFFTQRQEKQQAKKFGNDVILVLNAIDKKMQLDVYSTDSWKSESWDNNNDFLEKLIKEELRTANSSCGVAEGWQTDLVLEPLTLIPCNRWSGSKIPFKLNVKAEFTKDLNSEGGYIIDTFKIDYFFNNDIDFEKNVNTFLNVKKALDKYEHTKNITVHTYDFFNINSNEYLTLNECLDAKSKCGLRTQIELFSGISTDKLRLDGKNTLMGEIDFNDNNKCTEWVYEDSAWKSNKIECKIKGGFDSDSIVEAKINNTTITDRVALEKICEVFEIDETTDEMFIDTDTKKVPCGITKEGTIITSGFDKINSNIVLSSYSIINSGLFNIGDIKDTAKFKENLKSKNIQAEKSFESKDTLVKKQSNAKTVDTKSGNISKNFTAINYINENNLKTRDTELNLVLNSNNSSFNNIEIKPTSGVDNNVLINTRNFDFVSTAEATYNKIAGRILSNIETSNNFYSGYSPTDETDRTADQTYNTLRLDNLTGKAPKIIGTTKSRDIIRKEMNKSGANDLEVDIYKDSMSFYSDAGSKLKVNQLSSDGAKFTEYPMASGTAKEGYSVSAEAAQFTESINQTDGGIYVKRKGSNRVTVINGVMTITGENLGNGNTTGELLISWPNSDEANISENGLRNKVFRNSLTTIINGTTKVQGDITQWKPFHVNGVYTGTNVCDRPNGVQGACLMTVWRNLNDIQTLLQSTKREYEKIIKKLPPIKGGQGEKGEQGLKGDKGLDGYKGEKGIRGPQGPMEYLNRI